MGKFQNKLSIGWVHPKFTHAHPLTWGNRKNHDNSLWLCSKAFLMIIKKTGPH